MANNLIKTLFCHTHKCFLHSSVTLSASPIMPTTGISSSSFTVQFLVNSCGISLESALSVSCKFQLREDRSQRAQSVADFLKSHNFSDTHLAKLIVKRPETLYSRIKCNLQPKFDYLVKNGFKGELLPQMILSNPRILGYSLDSTVIPSFNFLRSFLHSDKKVLTSIKREPRLLISDLEITVQPNIEFLVKERVPVYILADLLASHPRALMQKHDRIVYAVNSLKNLGFKPTSPMFVRAITMMMLLSQSKWKKKFDVLKGLGFNEDEIVSAFKREPFVLGCSEEKLKKAIDFYINTVKFDLEVVIKNPKILNYAIEKRMIPRYNVLKVLESKKLIPSINNKSPSKLTISEDNFVKKYVLKHIVEVPSLLEIYPGAEKFLRKFIEKFKGNAPAALGIYPGAENLLKKYLEK